MDTKMALNESARYFFRKLERKYHQRLEAQKKIDYENREVVVDDLMDFFRSVATQNIFIYTVGVGGKKESTILSKAVFSMTKEVKVYYSTSFNYAETGFIRVRIDKPTREILIERMHGYRPVPEVLYHSKRQWHVIRFMCDWFLQRIDWSKTKVENLDMYMALLDERQKVLEEKIALQEELRQAEQIQHALKKHSFKRNALIK
jgi:hypothetical protein